MQTVADASLVLVVDDEPDNFDVIEIFLLKEGYELVYASSAKEALQLIEERAPDIILSDVMMPEITGIEFCKELKSRPDLKHIPVLMVTALGSKESMAECFHAGADDFISKPVNSIELRARVFSLLRIKQQYDELRRVLELREDLSNMIVHDIRSPLSGIILGSSILIGYCTTDKQIQLANGISRSADRLRVMCDDLLTTAKLDRGQLVLSPSSIDLYELAELVVSDATSIANQSNTQLKLDIPEQDVVIEGDRNLLRRVLENVLSNAIKYSPQNSVVTIKVVPQSEDGSPSIAIGDNGPGLSAEMKDKIFEKFATGDFAGNVSQVGLGLAFAKLVVDAHEGHIEVLDNEPQGSIFSIHF